MYPLVSAMACWTWSTEKIWMIFLNFWWGFSMALFDYSKVTMEDVNSNTRQLLYQLLWNYVPSLPTLQDITAHLHLSSRNGTIQPSKTRWCFFPHPFRDQGWWSTLTFLELGFEPGNDDAIWCNALHFSGCWKMYEKSTPGELAMADESAQQCST